MRRDLNVCLNQRVHQLQGDLRVNSQGFPPSVDQFRASFYRRNILRVVSPRRGENDRKKEGERKEEKPKGG